MEASLVQARKDLAEARVIATIPLTRIAARWACYAMFHAAEPLILAHTGKVAKTHRGTHGEFSRFRKGNDENDRKLLRILVDGYRHQELAGYSTDPDAVVR